MLHSYALPVVNRSITLLCAVKQLQHSSPEAAAFRRQVCEPCKAPGEISVALHQLQVEPI